MPNLVEAITLTEKLAGLNAQKAKLIDQLSLSLALKAFEPRAFKDDLPCRVGGTSHKDRPWEGTITIYLASGEDVAHKALEVPFLLWPVGMQAELHAISPKKRPGLLSNV